MKKWMYLIFPGVMLGVFLVIYFAHEKEADLRERTRAEEVMKKKAEDKRQKDIAEEKAKESAQKAQKEREQEEAKKDAERQAKSAAIDKEIADTTAAAVAEADKNAKQAAALEVELDRLHKAKDQLSRQTFDLAKQVELAKVDKGNAEMESQRMVEMIARRAAESSMTRMPMPPAPPAK
jgi:hypothetical protein